MSFARLTLYAPLIPEVLIREAARRASAVLRVEIFVARTVVVRVGLELSAAARLALDAAVGLPEGVVLRAGRVDVPAGRTVRQRDGWGVVDALPAVLLGERLEFELVVCALPDGEWLGTAYLYARDGAERGLGAVGDVVGEPAAVGDAVAAREDELGLVCGELDVVAL